MRGSVSGFKPTVFVIDKDEDKERKTLVRSVTSAGYQVTLFSSERELLSACLPDGPGCILLDTGVLKKKAKEPPKTPEPDYMHSKLPVVFMAGETDLSLAARGIREGGFGLVAKPVHESDLLAAVEEALNENDRRRHRDDSNRDVLQRLSTLTRRERAVLDMLVQGHSNRVIADRLHLSSRTVEGHRARVMTKMAAASLADLVTKIVLARPGADGTGAMARRPTSLEQG